MRQENKPAQSANNQGYSGENNQFLQYFHDLLLISTIIFPEGSAET